MDISNHRHCPCSRDGGSILPMSNININVNVTVHSTSGVLLTLGEDSVCYILSFTMLYGIELEPNLQYSNALRKYILQLSITYFITTH